MNFKKSASILRKINGIHGSLQENQEQPSSIEKDLLRSYLRDFYEVLLENDEEPEISSHESSSGIPKTDKISHSSQTIIPAVAAPVFTKEVEIPQVEEIIPTHSLNGGSTKVETITESTQVMEEVSEEHTLTEIEAEVEPIPEVEPIAEVQHDESLVELFEQQAISDLSEKLGQRPITDMKRSMGINEQILTRTELFNSDQDLFISTLVKLNEFSNYNQAADFLIKGVATEQNWSDIAKRKKAAGFIKLVQRRFLS